MINAGLFSSDDIEWETPPDLFDALDSEYHFTLDVCASADNYKVVPYFSRTENGLAQAWPGRCWMNPPYGDEIGLWVEKAAYEVRENDSFVVALLPVRTDTEWWHCYAMQAHEIRLIAGRLYFINRQYRKRKPAPFPSCLAFFKKTRRSTPLFVSADRLGRPLGRLGRPKPMKLLA